MLTQAGRLLGIFKTCASVPAGEPWGVEGTLVLWACPLGTVRSWQREEASLARLPSPESCPPFWNSHYPSSHWAGTPKPGKFLGCCRDCLSMPTHESAGPGKGSPDMINLVQG